MNFQINISEEEWILIEGYLDKKENRDIDRDISSIPNISEKIKFVEEYREAIEDSIRQSKIKEFQQFSNNLEKDPKNINVNEETERLKSRYILYTIAAVLVALFGIFWMMEPTSSPKKIFAAHFRPDPGLRTVMGVKSDYVFFEGMVAYKRKEYKEAINTWEQLLPEKEGNDTLNYFLGVAFLAQGNVEKSLEYLEPLQRFNKGIFKEDAAHYKALAKLKP